MPMSCSCEFIRHGWILKPPATAQNQAGHGHVNGRWQSYLILGDFWLGVAVSQAVPGVPSVHANENSPSFNCETEELRGLKRHSLELTESKYLHVLMTTFSSKEKMSFRAEGLGSQQSRAAISLSMSRDLEGPSCQGSVSWRKATCAIAWLCHTS